ncbi:MAG: right-handed parallel beta-helix repeat-containing protein [Fimbriimonadia bacterium]
MSLQDALLVAQPGDEIRIARGTYCPGPPGDTTASFQLRDGVTLLGGYVGGDMATNIRDPRANPTILCGDIGYDDVFGSGWWRTGWAVNSPNSQHVVSATDVSGATLDGLVVSQGYAIQSSGAGIYAERSDLHIRNCVFRRNASYQGRGTCAYILDSQVQFEGCRFEESYGRLSSGVGIGAYGASEVTVAGCAFYDLEADGDASSGNGGAIEFWTVLPATVVQCSFDRCKAFPFGGQYAQGSGTYGGAIHNFGAPLSVARCWFTNNISMQGGAIYSWKDLTVNNCVFSGNQTYALPTSQGQSIGGFGGAIATYSSQNYTLMVVGCTLVNNEAHETGGIWFNGYGTVSALVSGCILWGNRDQDGVHCQAQVKKASYCCIQNLWVPRPGEDPIDPAKFPHCFDLDPQFVAFPTDLRLGPNSPCLDAADRTAHFAGQFWDILGSPRFVDIVWAPDTGRGSSPLPDMGAFERQLDGPPVTGIPVRR